LQLLNQNFVQTLVARWQQQDTATREIDELASSPTTINAAGEVILQQAQVNVRYGRFLYTLVSMLKPARVLEIGMANGVSSAYIAKAMSNYADEQSQHVIIDPFQSSDWQGAGRHLLHRLSLDHYAHIIEDYSFHAVPNLGQENRRFDFVFIDGNHCMDYTLSDILVCARVLDIGGVIALDDAMAYGVKLAIPYVDQYRPDLQRVLLDAPMAHWFREHFFKRRRMALYEKVAGDTRGADTI